MPRPVRVQYLCYSPNARHHQTRYPHRSRDAWRTFTLLGRRYLYPIGSRLASFLGIVKHEPSRAILVGTHSPDLCELSGTLGFLISLHLAD